MGLQNVLAAFSVIATGGFLFGYIIGINGNVVTKGQLICPTDWTGPVGSWSSSGYGQCYALSAWDQGILSSLNLIGAVVSSAICFRYADTLGRKKEVQIGAALYMTGALLAALSPVLWGIYAAVPLGSLWLPKKAMLPDQRQSTLRFTSESATELDSAGQQQACFSLTTNKEGEPQDQCHSRI
ncbi:unnamed protein product [Effrenium voratum]|uniref:Major facilitator superfamily (MFS) profile domain-containing protein n=1 Tax=Effrenium voratum TaxID=2562239 RepID=A0AA36HX06_9DINO|nr:unnamed protein product [Effrenium voratum]